MSFTARFIQDGKSIDYTPVADVAAGAVITIGNIVGIAKLDIPANTLGAISLTGLYEVAKVTGGTIAAGDKLYWDATNSGVTITGGTATPYFGKAVEAAGGSATSVKAILG